MEIVKIICVSVTHKEEKFLGSDCTLLELYKQYEAVYRKHDRYYGFKGYVIPSIDLFGWAQWFPEECFITLVEWRDKQIDNILND